MGGARGFPEEVMIYNYAKSPYPDWHQRAWSAGFVLLSLSLAMNIVARPILLQRAGVLR